MLNYDDVLYMHIDLEYVMADKTKTLFGLYLYRLI